MFRCLRYSGALSGGLVARLPSKILANDFPGSLPTRNKPVASSTDKEQLYQRISELRGRVQELETALETVHASVSSEPHPLLSEESYMRKSLSRRRKTLNGQADEDEHDESEEGENLDEALGSLNVGGDGQTRYFGRSACVEVCRLDTD
jgi:hypothetical protein